MARIKGERIFCPICQVAETSFGRVRRLAAPGAKSAVCDFTLFAEVVLHSDHISACVSASRLHIVSMS